MTGVRILKLDLSSAVVLFRDLSDECRTACPGANLSHGLRIRLERLTKEERKNIVNQKNDGCSPLFVAAKRGNTEIVEYLIKTCDSDVEEKGLYQVPDDQSIHKVSPLWCAAVAGRLQVVKCLVKYGANINCVSDTGSTPVRSACFMTYYEIVKFLVESGADISIPNYNGGTCLINSVQSVPLCQYLLEKGASVNAVDIQNKTALHYAIQEHRLETAKLLIRFGADPFIMSRNGDDALQTACLKGATQIFDYLINEISYPIDRIADVHELMGSTFLDEHNDVQIALTYWRSAVQIRNVDPSGRIQKPLLPLNPSYGNIKEFQTLDELDNMAGDLETMRIQSIMVCERILGCKHKDLIFRLMFRGAAYADALRYDICISLWRRALELRIHRDTLLYNEAVFTAQALARLFIDLQTKPQDGLSDFRLDVADVLSTWRILMEHLPESRQMLETRPIWKRHEECFDRLLKVISHLVYVFAAMPRQEIVRCGILQEIHNLLSMDLRTSSGDTLLHLAVSADNCIKHSGYADETPILCFPDLHVTQLLIACGVRIDSQNARGSTPLHVSSVPGNLKMEILNTLLSSGAHIDQRNICDERPLDFLKIYPRTPHSLIFSHENLKCLSARVLAANRIPYHGRVPKPLEEFIAMH